MKFKSHIRAIILIGLAVGLLALTDRGTSAFGQPQKTAPTFDCEKASGDIEKLVCTDAALSGLDRKMAEVYSAAMKTWPADVAAQEKTYQRGWIKGRNDCWKSPDKRACVETSFRTRIVGLQIKSGQLMVPTPVGYTCSNQDDKPFTATFYQQTDPPSAVLTYGDDQVIAFLAPTGSGSKYIAANMEFWEHGGEASVDWYGVKMTCKAGSRTGKPA